MEKRILDEFEHSITKKYRMKLYSKFVAAINDYKLVEDGDKICVCISGGKDSMLMGKMFQIFHEHSSIKFDVEYLVMDPGYNKENLELIKNNLKLLGINAHIMATDIFAIADLQTKSPCFLCAKMRRGALYNLARQIGCNKIALGHHYDDVIITTLMNLLNAGSFQTMLPKLLSTNYKGMELIRPLYYIREKDIISWMKFNELKFLQCACSRTKNIAENLKNGNSGSQRVETKKLIENLMKNYNVQVEKNLFKATSNVNLDMILGYKSDDYGIVNFLDNYDAKKKALKNKK